MSNLDNIIEKIASDAREKSDVILTQAKKEAEEILNKSAALAKEEEEKILTRANNDAKALVEKEISKSHLVARDMQLKAKEEIIQRVFELVKFKLEHLDEQDFLNYLKSNIKQLNLNYKSEIKVPAKYRKAVESLNLGWNISDYNKSGFEIISDNVVYNSNFSTLLDSKRDEFEKEIADKLFKN